MTRIIIIIASLIIVGCNPNKDKIGKVRSLHNVLDNTVELLDEVDTNTAYTANSQLQEELLFVQKTYQDTMDKETAMLLGDFYSMRKVLSYHQNNYEKYIEEIAYSRSQLDDLIADLENNKVPEDKFNQYYQSELDAILDLNTRIQHATNNAVSALDKYEKQHAKLQEIIDQLKAQRDTTSN